MNNFSWNYNMSQFQYLICSVENNTWAYEIWESLHFVLFTFYTVPTFLELGLYNNKTEHSENLGVMDAEQHG